MVYDRIKPKTQKFDEKIIKFVMHDCYVDPDIISRTPKPGMYRFNSFAAIQNLSTTGFYKSSYEGMLHKVSDAKATTTGFLRRDATRSFNN